MAKKYHGHPKDTHRIVKGEHPEYARRSKHMAEDHMIKNDETKIANMPQEVMMKKYSYPMMVDEYYNDGLSGVDEQMDGDVGSLKKQYAPHKF